MKIFTSILLILTVTIGMSSASAQSHFSDNYAQQFQQRNNTYAGLYFSMPLGGKKKKADSYKFGFKMTARPSFMGRQSNQSANFHGFKSASFKGQQQFTGQMEVMNISFNQNGFKQANLMHLPLVAKTADGRFIYLDDKEDGKKGGITVGKVLLWTGVAVVGVIVIGMLGSCIEGVDEDDIVDFCPV